MWKQFDYLCVVVLILTRTFLKTFMIPVLWISIMAHWCYLIVSISQALRKSRTAARGACPLRENPAIESALACCAVVFSSSLSTLKIMRADWVEWDHWSRTHSWNATLMLLLLFFNYWKWWLCSVVKRLFYVWHFLWMLFGKGVTQHCKVSSQNKHLPPQAWHLVDQGHKNKERKRKVRNITAMLFVPRPYLDSGSVCFLRPLTWPNNWTLRAVFSVIFF